MIHRPSVPTALLLALAAPLAHAQQEPLDVERFKPALTWDSFVVTEGSAIRPDWPNDAIHLGAAANFSLNPLVVVGPGGQIEQRFVSRRLGADLYAGTTVIEPLSIAVGVPVFAAQAGDLDPNPAGFGDVRLIPKVRILDDRSAFGLALLTEVRLPTHSDDEFSGGARSPVFAPKLAIDHRFPFGFRVGGNAGVLLREGTQFQNVRAASEFTYSAAAELHLGGYYRPLALGADVHGGTGLRELNYEELPLEAQTYVRVDLSDTVVFHGGPGFGVIPGYGTPTLRVFAGIRWAPTSHDADHDGIPDEEDRCRTVPEDRNGKEDLDGCPDGNLFPATVEVRDENGDSMTVPYTIEIDGEDEQGRSGVDERLPPGRYPITVTADGYEPAEATLVVTPEGENKVVMDLTPLPAPPQLQIIVLDPDGEPLKTAKSRMDDQKDSANNMGIIQLEPPPGKQQIWLRAKGHVPVLIEVETEPGGEYTVEVTLEPIEITVGDDDYIKLSGAVHFDTGSAKLLPESHDILDEVATVLLENKGIRHVRVEGHTDSRGAADMNQKLSEARARSVVEYLVSVGIERERLDPQGFGETQPISENDDENRRVEFVITKGKAP